MDNFLLKIKNKDIDFNENNKNYIYYEEKLNNKGKRLDYIKQNNLSINNFSHHSPSCYKLYNVLKKLKINNEDKIIDIGSGKGFALSIFNLYNFSKITGIELDKELLNISIKNFKILDIKNIELINYDAIKFNKYDEYNLFYFYNPFSKESFKIILDKISIKNNKIIFKNLSKDYQNILSNYNLIKLFEEEGEERNYEVFKFL